MVEPGGIESFAPESQVQAAVFGHVRAQHLDRDVTMQPQVASEVHLTHAAEAKNLAEFVAAGQSPWRRHDPDQTGAVGACRRAAAAVRYAAVRATC